MMEFLKGFRTVLLGLTATVVGGLTAGGFLTPELGADVSANVHSVVDLVEQTAGAIEALTGVLILALRAVTSTPIFKKY